MHRSFILLLAACGGGIRHGDALPTTLVQPNRAAFSAPRPLEDWLPPRPSMITQQFPTGPYRILSQMVQRGESGADQIVAMPQGEGESVLRAHWHGAHGWFSVHYAQPTVGVGVVTAPIGSEPYAGIECQTWRPGRAELDGSDVVGAFVSRVAEGSPAEAAGLRGGELVLSWHGSTGTFSGGCTQLDEFLHAQLASDPNVFLSVWVPSMGAAMMSSIAVPERFGPLGISVGTLEHRDVQAPFVLATDQRAEHLGFRPGDLVLAVDHTDVHWKRDLHDALAEQGFPSASRATTIEVARFGVGRWVPMTVVPLPADRYQEVQP